MTIKIPNGGEAKLIAYMLGKDAIETFQLRLYTNNITPSETDLLATYTQATGGGYAGVNLTPANWTITQGAPTIAAYPQIVFTFSAAIGSVYGYYIVGVTSNLLLWAERFTDGPYGIVQSGDAIRVTPRITIADTLD